MSNTNNIRTFMEILDEASLKDVAASATTHLKAAVGDKKSQGKVESQRLAKYLKKQYTHWLGQTGAETTEESLMKFLVSKIGFTPANARKIFQKAGVQDPTKMESLTEALNDAALEKALLAAAQFAYEYDLVPSEKEKEDDDGKFRKKSSSSSSSYSRRRYNRDDQDDDILRGIRPKDNAESVKANAKVVEYAHIAGLEDEHLDELLKLVKATNGTYGVIKKINNQEERDDALEMLARMGYAYLRSQIKN